MKQKNINLVCIFILTFFLNITNDLGAQPGFGRGGMGFGRGPMALGIQYEYFDPSAIHQILGSLSKTIPIGAGRRPGASPLARGSFLNLNGGIRFGGNLDSTEFRWRVAVIDADIYRRFFRFGFTIVDLDKTGILDKDYRWVNFRLGLAPGIGSQTVFVSPFVMGIAGIGSWEMGAVNYPGSGSIADSSLSGSEAGYQFGIVLGIFRHIIVTADYKERILVDGPEPRFKTWGGEIRLMPGRKFRMFGRGIHLYIRYEREKLELNDSILTEKNIRLKAGIQFIPAPPKKRNPWE